MRWLKCVGLMCLVLPCASACTIHNVKYDAFVKCKIAPTDHATSIEGRFDEAKALATLAKGNALDEFLTVMDWHLAEVRQT